MEAGKVAFEDIHAAAATLAACRLGHAQKRAADREARRLSRTIRARRAEVKAQLPARQKLIARFAQSRHVTFILCV
jgi:hypothetical protein